MVGRSIATTIMWVAYLIVVSSNIVPMGNMVVILALVLMIPLVAMSAMIWGVVNMLEEPQPQQSISQDDIEKRKRERIDEVLRDLSDEDLMRLKQRLASGVITEENLYQNLVGDDGELVDYSG